MCWSVDSPTAISIFSGRGTTLPRSKSADVRPPCDTPCIGSNAERHHPAERLNHEPDAEKKIRRKLHDLEKEDDGDERCDPRGREHEHVRTKHTCNRSACADHRHL